MNRNLNYRMRSSLYELKKLYGGRITIHQRGVSTADPRTGLKTVSSTQFRIRRAIILPAEIARQEVRGISLISANKGLVQGGWYDDNQHVFIVETRDAKGLALTPDDWIIFENLKYQIVEFRHFVFDSCWVITANALLGEIPPQSIAVSADNSISLSQESATEE